MQKALYRWLLLVGAGHIALGLAFIVAARTAILTPYIDNLYQAMAIASPSSGEPLLRVFLQLFGATVISWGLLFCIAIYACVKLASAEIKYATIAAVLIWFGLDTYLSMSNHIYLHLQVNMLAFAAIIPPLLLLKPGQLQ